MMLSIHAHSPLALRQRLTVRRLRSAGHSTPCVLMTGHIDASQRRSEFVEDIAAVLEKPFLLEDLLDVVDKISRKVADPTAPLVPQRTSNTSPR